MLDRYDYEIEDVLIPGEKNELLELKELRSKLQYIKDYIEANCVYDEHLMGYCFGLSTSQVRTLMYILKEDKRSEE